MTDEKRELSERCPMCDLALTDCKEHKAQREDARRAGLWAGPAIQRACDQTISNIVQGSQPEHTYSGKEAEASVRLDSGPSGTRRDDSPQPERAEWERLTQECDDLRYEMEVNHGSYKTGTVLAGKLRDLRAAVQRALGHQYAAGIAQGKREK